MSLAEILDAASKPAAATLIAFLGSAIAPVSVWLHNRAKLRLQEQAQEHKIITGYLDRALDPNVPLAIRQQLLRFLSTSAKDGRQLETWARQELKRVDAVVEGLDGEIVKAEKSVNAAQTPKALREAQARLQDAVKKKKGALEPVSRPAVSAAAIRAGFYSSSRGSLMGADLRGWDLSGARLIDTNLRGADLSKANLQDTHLGSADLRASDLSGADLRASFMKNADLRAANLCGANLSGADLERARLEGADLTGAILTDAHVGAVYSDNTRWPDGFDPIVAGAVHVDGESVKAVEPLPANDTEDKAS